MKTKGENAQAFIEEAFDYLSTLVEVSIDRSVNRYLLEHIANGFVKFGSVEGFIDHVDDWLRNVIKTYPEVGFDHSSHQVLATIDLVDQVVVIDESLFNDLTYVRGIQGKYGMYITYDGNTVTIAKFFENIERKYPVIKGRYKGLGSSDARVSKEIIMDPRTRRIFRVDASDVNTMKIYDMLVGKNKEDILARKEMLMNFQWKPTDIDT